MGISRRSALRLGSVAMAGVVVGCARDGLVSVGVLPDPEADAGDALGADAGSDRDAGLDAGLDAGREEGVDAGAPDAGEVEDAGSVPADAGQPAMDAGQGGALPLLFAQISDVHIGSGAFARPALEYTLNQLIPALGVDAVFATGDLVETGNDLVDWGAYRDLVDAAGYTAANYLETPGNHDSLLDGTLANYLSHTLAGRAGHGTFGVHYLSLGGKRIRVVVVNTASAGDPARDSVGYLAGGQVDALIDTIDRELLPVDQTIVLGHHPPTGPQGLGVLRTDGNLRRLLARTGACAYLFGHVHIYVPAWDGPTLMVQATTEGNRHNGDTGVTWMALDDGPVVKNIPLLGDPATVHVDWPVVMITRPANRDMGANLLTGDRNPWATGLVKGSTGNLLTAVVAAPGGTPTVLYRVDVGPWQAMTRVGNAWQARFDAPQASGVDLEVRAWLNGAVGSDTVHVALR